MSQEEVLYQNTSGNGKRKVVSAHYSMTPHDHHLIVDSSSAAVNVTLPALGDAYGIYVFSAPVGATNDVSLLVKESGSELAAGGDMDAANEITVIVPANDGWEVIYTTVS